MILMLRLRSVRAPYTRGAVRFHSTREAVEVPADTLTAAQVERLRNDPLISVEIYAADDTGAVVETPEPLDFDDLVDVLRIEGVPSIEDAARTLAVGVVRDPAVVGAATALAAQLAAPVSGVLAEAAAQPSTAASIDPAATPAQAEIAPVARVDGLGAVDIGGPSAPFSEAVAHDIALAGGLAAVASAAGMTEAELLAGEAQGQGTSAGAVAPIVPGVVKAKRSPR